MKLSLWTRARGRFAVMMVIVLFTWCSFLSWNFWVQVYYSFNSPFLLTKRIAIFFRVIIAVLSKLCWPISGLDYAANDAHVLQWYVIFVALSKYVHQYRLSQ